MGVSLRTLYRDIATLRGQGARVEGEPGIGYLLRPGFTLPPLMFSIEELEALVLGSRWVAQRSDDRAPVGGGARRAGQDRRRAARRAATRGRGATLLVGPAAPHVDTVDAAQVREAIRRERSW